MEWTETDLDALIASRSIVLDKPFVVGDFVIIGDFLGTVVPDYNSYMDTQHAINLELYRRVEEMGVEFAFPTRTLHLELEEGAIVPADRG